MLMRFGIPKGKHGKYYQRLCWQLSDKKDAANLSCLMAQGSRERLCKRWVLIYLFCPRYTVPSRRVVWPSLAQYIHRNFAAHLFQRSVKIWVLLGRWFCNDGSMWQTFNYKFVEFTGDRVPGARLVWPRWPFELGLSTSSWFQAINCDTIWLLKLG